MAYLLLLAFVAGGLFGGLLRLLFQAYDSQ